MMGVARHLGIYRGVFIHDFDRIVYVPNTTPSQSFEPGPACLSTSPSSFPRFHSDQQTKCILCAFLPKTYMILITSLAQLPKELANWHLSNSATLPMLGPNSLAFSYLARLDRVDTSSCWICCIGNHITVRCNTICTPWPSVEVYAMVITLWISCPVISLLLLIATSLPSDYWIIRSLLATRDPLDPRTDRNNLLCGEMLTQTYHTVAGHFYSKPTGLSLQRMVGRSPSPSCNGCGRILPLAIHFPSSPFSNLYPWYWDARIQYLSVWNAVTCW